jgi:nicotinate-nucleotide adenylyltransferase
MRIGIFGGTFDPPHMGHLILAQEAREQLYLDEILWVLTPYPPHKTGQRISLLEARLAMVLLAISENSSFTLSRVDIDRQPPHYAVDTVAILREKSPLDEFYYLMGEDSLGDIHDWHDPDRFISECQGIVVMTRNGGAFDISEVTKNIPGLSGKIHMLKTPIIEISGTEIRRRAAIGRSIRYFLPDTVHQYILVHKLYQT